MLKQTVIAISLALVAGAFSPTAMAEDTNGNNGWGNGGGDGTTPGSDNGTGFGMTIGDHGSTRFHAVEGGTKSTDPTYNR